MMSVDFSVEISFLVLLLGVFYFGYPFIKKYVASYTAFVKDELDRASMKYEDAQKKLVKASRDLDHLDDEVKVFFKHTQDQIELLIENIKKETACSIQKKQDNLASILEKVRSQVSRSCEDLLSQRVIEELHKVLEPLLASISFQENFFSSQVSFLIQSFEKEQKNKE